jgi:hypothetical protein
MGLGPYLQLGPPTVNVRNFGAVGDGVANDTAAFLAADAALRGGVGTFYIPDGTYRLNQVLTPRGRVVYKGASRDGTILSFVGASGFNFTAAATDFNNCYITWEDLTIRGDYTAGKTGIYLKYSHWWQLKRVIIERFADYGLDLERSYVGCIGSGTIIRDCDQHGVRAGIAVTVLTLEGGSEIRSNNGWGIYAFADATNRQNGLNLLGATVEDNRLGGLSVDYAGPVCLIGSHFENNAFVNTLPAGRGSFVGPVVGQHIQLGAGAANAIRGFVSIGCSYATCLGTGGTGYHIDNARAQGYVIAGNEFSAGATKAIKNDIGGSSNGVISPGNYYSGSITTPEVVEGASTFNGTTGRVITHNLANTTYRVAITPTATLLGRWYVTKGSSSFTVFSTDAADAGAFDYVILEFG